MTIQYSLTNKEQTGWLKLKQAKLIRLQRQAIWTDLTDIMQYIESQQDMADDLLYAFNCDGGFEFYLAFKEAYRKYHSDIMDDNELDEWVSDQRGGLIDERCA